MSRRRFAVALIPPPDLARTLDAFRVAVGARRPPNIAPHITLIPPVNIRDDEVDEVRRAVQAAADATVPFDVTVGPVATFSPGSPTIHLAVDAPAVVVLRDLLRVGPFDRPDRRPFVPHLTLDASADVTLIDASLVALRSYRAAWVAGSVHLLEHIDDGVIDRRRWVPVTEESFGGPVVVGRGGVEITMRTTETVTSEVESAAGLDSGQELITAWDGTDPFEPVPGGRWLVVSAEEQGEPVGTAIGSTAAGVAILDRIRVERASRHRGIGRHLLGQWCSQAAACGAAVALSGATRS